MESDACGDEEYTYRTGRFCCKTCALDELVEGAIDWDKPVKKEKKKQKKKK